jgi:hypothetical protein
MTSMTSMTSNDWCRILGIEVPSLAAVVSHREANTYSLLLVALLECGKPMSLHEVAARFEAAGVADQQRALLSLQRCKPARAPVYREGDLYCLDPHDEELDLWVFRLGLRPPKFARPETPPPKQLPQLPGSDIALTNEELDEAWHDANLRSWSAQRLALAVLDASGQALTPAEVVAAVAARTRWHGLREDAKLSRRGSAVALVDGRWAISANAAAMVASVRAAVRELVARSRRYAATRPDAATIAAHEAHRAEVERKRVAHGAELARLPRALLVAFPRARPRAVALLDVGQRELVTFVDDELDGLRSRLAAYEILGGVEVRALLRSLDFDPGERRLAELGPPQKSKKLNKRGRTLAITTALLVQGSCGISKPFGDAKKLAAYLAAGEITKLRRRLEADVKSLFALYEYGRLQGAVRLRWGFLDERIPAPWVHRDEPTLREFEKSALAMNVPLEVVVGNAPGWEQPWSRARIVHVEQDSSGWRPWLVDENGCMIDDADVQRARLCAH